MFKQIVTNAENGYFSSFSASMVQYSFNVEPPDRVQCPSHGAASFVLN